MINQNITKHDIKTEQLNNNFKKQKLDVDNINELIILKSEENLILRNELDNQLKIIRNCKKIIDQSKKFLSYFENSISKDKAQTYKKNLEYLDDWSLLRQTKNFYHI